MAKNAIHLVKETAQNVWFYRDFHSTPIGNNNKVIGLMKDELGGRIVNEFVALRLKMYSYLTDRGQVGWKAKGTKKYVIKREIKF